MGLIPGQEDPLEEEMATHSSMLAWKISWTEEPGGYSPWGPQSLTQLSTSTQHSHSLLRKGGHKLIQFLTAGKFDKYQNLKGTYPFT